MSWTAENLRKDSHCFFGIEGGFSEGKYASLNTNLRSRDVRENVLKNLDVIANTLCLQRENMATIRQSVSNTAVFIDKPTWFEYAADGLVTTCENILLCIKTADCAPVLLADYEHGVIGAAHAGWRGAYRGIVENVVRLMLEHGAQIANIAAAVGPCLQQDSFETKDDMKQIFIDENSQNERYFQSVVGGFHFDLSGYVEDTLKQMGIENVRNSRIDTYPVENGYFSYRRNTHLGLIEQQFDYPTQYSAICLRGNL